MRPLSADERIRLLPGCAAIAVAAAPIAWISIQRPDVAISPRVLAWWACVTLFVAVFMLQGGRTASRSRIIASQVAQSLLALAANWLIPIAIEGVALTGVLLVVAAAGLARFRGPVSHIWIAAQSCALLAIYIDAWPAPIALVAAVAYAAMQTVVCSTLRLAAMERERRVTLEGVVRELQSTQAMLEQTVRSAERWDLARDLHDVVGHHLVALGLQLDAALAAGAAPEAMRERLTKARQLVRLVLADVREVVSDLRTGNGVELRTALTSLATDGPGPRVEVRVSENAPEMSSAVAQTLLRCAQEALTNARKHAGASLVRVELDESSLSILDNGRGVVDGQGFGFESMRSRCAEAGCSFDARPAEGGGTVVEVRWRERATP